MGGSELGGQRSLAYFSGRLKLHEVEDPEGVMASQHEAFGSCSHNADAKFAAAPAMFWAAPSLSQPHQNWVE
jgi:hypothetical protein